MDASHEGNKGGFPKRELAKEQNKIHNLTNFTIATSRLIWLSHWLRRLNFQALQHLYVRKRPLCGRSNFVMNVSPGEVDVRQSGAFP